MIPLTFADVPSARNLFQLFDLEEARQRKYDVYARVIQSAFRKHFAKRRRVKLCEEAADLLAGRKERRANSLNRNYVGDYIGLDARPDLTQFIPRRCRIEFAQSVGKFDRRFAVSAVHIPLANYPSTNFSTMKCSKMSYSKVKIRLRIIELSHSEVHYLTTKFVVR